MKSPSLQAAIAAFEQHGPMTVPEVARATGIREESMARAFRRSKRRKDGLIYVHHWEKRDDLAHPNLGPYVAVWAAGNEPDKPRPKPIVNKVARAAYRTRHRERVRASQRKAKPSPATWITGL